MERLKQKLASGAGGDLTAEAREVNGVKVLATKVDGADAKTLRVTMDKVKDKLGSAVILLAAADGDKVALVAGVTKDLTDRVKAGDLMKHVAEQVGGRAVAARTWPRAVAATRRPCRRRWTVFRPGSPNGSEWALSGHRG